MAHYWLESMSWTDSVGDQRESYVIRTYDETFDHLCDIIKNVLNVYY